MAEHRRFLVRFLPAGESIDLPFGRETCLVGRGDGADIPIADESCSREQFRIRIGRDGCVLEPISSRVATFVNQRIIGRPRMLEDHDVISFGSISLEFRSIRTDSGGSSPLTAQTVPYGKGHRPAGSPGGPPPVEARLLEPFEISGATLIGRQADAVDLVLEHPQVSRRHAEITTLRGGASIRDLRSTNGTYVNGTRLAGATALRPGDRIDIGPFSLVFRGRYLEGSSREGNLQVIAENLSRVVHSRDLGRPIRILHDVSLVVEPGELVCLIGPSGSGKSTLMNALSARVPASEGRVLLNGVDLYSNFDALKRGIAIVSQSYALHEELFLSDALYFTAKLRFPPDTPRGALSEAVGAALATVNLEDRARTRIADLSGGQKKRAGLANEMISRPSLLFLDEVTSGLDEGIDWEMMRLFRGMADGGMTIICVTHSLSNVEEFCHRVAVISSPGVLAFYGAPGEATAFFGTKRLGDIYRRLAQRSGEEWRDEFQGTREYEAYVASPLERRRPSSGGTSSGRRRASMPRAGREMVRQLAILTSRLTRQVLADPRTLVTAGLQSLTIGGLLALVFEGLPEHDPREYALLFLLGISALWFGCNNASKEIVKERLLFQRERDINLSVTSYVLSKVLVVGVLVWAQTALLYALVAALTRIPGSGAQVFFVMSVVGLAGTTLGLLVSVAARSSDQANTIVPIVLIPQIILAGIIVEHLPPIPDRIADVFITGFWMYEGMKAILGAKDSLVPAMLIIVIHTFAFLGAAVALLHLGYDGTGRRQVRLLESRPRP